MFPLCLPFVTPGTEMSLGKERHVNTHTHTHWAQLTHAVGEVLRQQSYCVKASGSRKKN